MTRNTHQDILIESYVEENRTESYLGEIESGI